MEGLDLRNNVKNKLNLLIENENITRKLEKGIYNYIIEYAEKDNIIKKWNNTVF